MDEKLKIAIQVVVDKVKSHKEMLKQIKEIERVLKTESLEIDLNLDDKTAKKLAVEVHKEQKKQANEYNKYLKKLSEDYYKSDLNLYKEGLRVKRETQKQQRKEELNSLDVANLYEKINIFEQMNPKALKNETTMGMLDDLKNSLSDVSNVDMAKANKQLNLLKNTTKQLGLEGSTSMNELFNNVKKFTQWYLIGGVVSGLTRAFKSMFSEVVKLDAELTEFNKVADLSTGELEKFTKEAYNTAGQIGRLGSEMINVSAEFKKAGYTLEESMNLGKTALTMTNIGDGITDVSDASSTLIAVLKGFSFDSSMSNSVLDMMNEVANTAPISFDKLADGLQRVSGTMSQTGTTIEETIGLLTGGFASLRDIESVSSALVFMSQRLRGVNEDGETIDGLAPKLKKAFGEVGIAIEDTNGELRSTFDIVSDYVKIYDTLSSKRQQYLSEMAIGNRNVKTLNAIIQNWGDVESAIDSATNSVGSAERENAIFMDSIQGKINELKSLWEELAITTISSDFIKGIISATSGILGFINSAGGLIPIMSTIIGFIMVIKGQKIMDGLKTMKLAFAALTSHLSTYTVGAGTATVATKGLSLSLNSLIPVIGLVITAFSILSMIFNGVSAAQEKRISENEEEARKSKEVSDAIQGLISEYEELAKITNKTEEEKSRLKEIQDALIKTYGLEAEGVDLVNGGYEEQIKLIREANREKLLETQRTAKLAYDDAVKDYNKVGYVSIKSKSDKVSTEDIEKINSLLSEDSSAYLTISSILKKNPKKTLNFATLIGDRDLKNVVSDMNVILEYMESIGETGSKSYNKLANKHKEYSDRLKDFNSKQANYQNAILQNSLNEAIIQLGSPKTLSDINNINQSMMKYGENMDYAGLSASDFALYVRDYVNQQFPILHSNTTDATEEFEKFTKQIENSSSSLKESITGLDDLSKGLSTIEGIQKTLNDGEVISYDQYASLFELYPELVDMVSTGGEITIDVLDDVRKKYYETNSNIVKESLKATKQLIDDTETRISALKKELLALKMADTSGTLFGEINPKVQQLERLQNELKDLNTIVKDGEIKLSILENENAIKEQTKAYEEQKGALEDRKKVLDDNIESLKEEKQAIDDNIAALKEQLNLYKDAEADIKNLAEMVMEVIKERKKVEKEALQEKINNAKESIKALEDEYKEAEKLNKNKIESYQNEQKALKDIIDKRKESLDLKKQEDDYGKTLLDKQKEISDIQAQITTLSFDKSRDSQNKVLQLTEDLNKKKSDLEDYQIDRRITLEKKALDDEYDKFVELQESKIKTLEEELQKHREIVDKEVEKIEIQITQKEQSIENIDDYLSRTGELYRDALNEIDTRSESLLSELLQYNEKYGKSTDSEIKQAWDKAYRAIDKFGVGQKKAYDTLVLLANKMSDFNNRIGNAEKAANKLGVSIKNAENKVKSLVAQINKIPSSKTTTHTINEVVKKTVDRGSIDLYRQQREIKQAEIDGIRRTIDQMTGYGQRGNPNLATYESALASAYEQLAKIPVYHTQTTGAGGVELKENELLAKLMKGEVVVNQEGMQNINRTIAELVGISGNNSYSNINKNNSSMNIGNINIQTPLTDSSQIKPVVQELMQQVQRLIVNGGNRYGITV